MRFPWAGLEDLKGKWGRKNKNKNRESLVQASLLQFVKFAESGRIKNQYGLSEMILVTCSKYSEGLKSNYFAVLSFSAWSVWFDPQLTLTCFCTFVCVFVVFSFDTWSHILGVKQKAEEKAGLVYFLKQPLLHQTFDVHRVPWLPVEFPKLKN